MPPTVVPAMADDAPLIVDPVVPAHDAWFDVYQTANCMKQPVYVYRLNGPLDDRLAEAMAPLGSVLFPLGRQCGVVRLDVPGRFLLTGILGLRELRITLRLNALADTRAGFEALLARYAELIAG